MAQTTAAKIPKIKVHHCDRAERGKPGVCRDYEQGWSYAIPLEVIYMTPLYSWNPYNIAYTEDKKSQQYKDVDSNGRNGGMTKQTAYKGTKKNVFYRTPAEFFEGDADTGDSERDPADTSKGTVGVLDPEGNVRRVVASGTRILLPDIPGVGKMRTRYPIAPLYNDGNNVQIELAALKDIVLKQQTNAKMFVEQPLGSNSTIPEGTYKFELGPSDEAHGGHTHTFEIPESKYMEMVTKGAGVRYWTPTSEVDGHKHSIQLLFQNGKGRFFIKKCDGKNSCDDGHSVYPFGPF